MEYTCMILTPIDNATASPSQQNRVVSNHEVFRAKADGPTNGVCCKGPCHSRSLQLPHVSDSLA